MHKLNTKKIAVVDLFCGAGGLTHGLKNEGMKIRGGFDLDATCKFAYEENNNAPFIEKDINNVNGKEVLELYKKSDIKVLAGCAPCQPFSQYTQGTDSKHDKKWGALYQFSRIVRDTLPDIVTMENVPQLIKHDVYDDFVSDLKKLGYFVRANIVFCPNYGIPQSRRRLVLLASKFGEIELIPETHNKENYNTVISTIGHLEPISQGGGCKSDPLHTSSGLSQNNLERIKASKPGGSWLDWNEDLVANCHKKKGRETYIGVYGRMSWDKPSPTMTTQFISFGSGRFGHPEQNRAISLREGALLQTFPEGYKFSPPNKRVVLKNVARMIGNAVPVDLGRVIAKSIKVHVFNHKNKIWF